MASTTKILQRGFKAWKEGGISGLRKQAKNFLRKGKEKERYREWLRRAEKRRLSRSEAEAGIAALSVKPLISIVMPVYNVDEKWLRRCIGSVMGQLYPYWELCIADDASTLPHIRKTLEEYAAKDQRIKVIFRQENGHISAASNSALELAAGEWTVLLDHDDELATDALYWIAREMNDHPEAQMIYSDEDLIHEDGRRSDPKFKPDWSPDFFYSLNLITHLSAYRTGLLRKIGGFRLGFEGSQDYDLALRAIEQIPETAIRHIPKILYHWRAISGSVALDPDEKPYAHERAREALREHFARTGVEASVMNGYGPLHRVTYDLPGTVKVTVICGKDEKSARGWIEKAGHKNIEWIKTSNDDSSPAAQLNSAAKKATGEILVFLISETNTDVEVSENWLRELAGFARQEAIGAAGGKLLYADGTIHQGGVILGINGTLGFAYRGAQGGIQDSLLRAQVSNNFSAVSGVCLATRRELFERLGGFDENKFPRGLFDVDYCLRLRENSYRIVWTPSAEFVSDEMNGTEMYACDPTAIEDTNFRERWKHLLKSDPYYNPNLSLDGENLAIDLT